MSHGSSRRSAALALTMAAASWGIGTVVSKRAVAEIPPLTLLPIQLATSLVALAILMRLRGLPLRDPGASPLLGRLGLLNPGLAYALSLVGLVRITASLSVLLWAMEPLLILFLAGLLLRERIGPALVVLSLVAAGGMVLVIYRPDTAGDPLGVALTLAGVACCATYTVATRRWIATADSTAPVVVAQQAYALGLALVVLGGIWVLGGGVLPGQVTAAGWASAIGSGVLYYGLAYWFYLSALRHIGASSAAASFYLIPVFGVSGGVVFLGERLDAVQWIGAAIVLGAVFTILRRTREGAAEPGPVPIQEPVAGSSG